MHRDNVSSRSSRNSGLSYLRMASAIVLKLGGTVLPLFGCIAAFVAAIIGFKLLFHGVGFLVTHAVDYATTIESTKTVFTENFIILASWIMVWQLKTDLTVMNTTFLLGVLPLCFSFIKYLLLDPYVKTIALTEFTTLGGWMQLLKNDNIILMLTESFAIADVSVALLMLRDHNEKSLFTYWWGSKMFIFVMLLTAFMVCPLGLTLYTVVSCFKSLKKAQQQFLVVVIPVAAAVAYNSYPHILELPQPDVMFFQNRIGIFGVFALVLWLFFSKLATIANVILMSSVALPAFNYINVLIQYQVLNPNAPKTDFFSLAGWEALMQDKYILFSSLAHVLVANLMVAKLLLIHYKETYNVADQVVGKIIFFPFLLVTCVLSPVGLLSYVVFQWIYLDKHCKKVKNPRNPVLDLRPVHFGETLPEFVRSMFYVFKGVVGFIGLVACSLLYIWFVVFCYVYSILCSVRKPVDLHNPTFSQFPDPSRIVPAFMRNVTGQMRVHLYATPLNNRGVLWKIKFFTLQFASFVEIGVNANVPSPLSAKLAQQFGPVFPFGDGIGIGGREKIMEYLSDTNCRKGPRSLAGTVSKTQSEFSHFSTITMGLAPESERNKVLKAREVLHEWLRHFSTERDASFDSLVMKFPRVTNDVLPSDQDLFSVFGDVLYWMATRDDDLGSHGEMTLKERTAFSELVNNLFQFFPGWFNFLLFGGYMERKVNEALYTMRDAMFRDKGAGYHAAVRMGYLTRGGAIRMEESETLRLIVSVFAIAGAAVPAKLLAAILKRIHSDPTEMRVLYARDPIVFIKECARLDPAVFWVNLISHKTENIGHVEIPPGTPVHLYIPFANLDADQFGPNPLNFSPFPNNGEDPHERLGKIMTWNGLEKGFEDGNSPYPRACPGHDVAILALKLIVDHYLPQIAPAKDIDVSAVEEGLDIITSQVASISTMKSKNWFYHNHYEYDNFEQRNLQEIDCPPFKLPTYDEDFKNGLTPAFDLLAQAITFIPVKDAFWTAPDVIAEAWRKKHLALFPAVHVDYGSNAEEMNSDVMIRRLAFFGLAAHRTRHNKISKQKKMKMYVNDTTQLESFAVRDGYLKYGAIAYFDQNYMPSVIYVSHLGHEVIRPADGSYSYDWELAKWAWKVSMFSLVTLYDHLLVCHLIKANALAKCSREELPMDHVLRVVLKPFTFHTIYINQLAGRTLYCENGLASRVWAFNDVNGMLSRFKDTYEYSRDFIGMSSAPEEKHPIARDYNRLLKVLVTYMSASVALVPDLDADNCLLQRFYQSLAKNLSVPANSPLNEFSRENLVTILSDLIMNGTGVHSHVGQISDYQIFPNLTGAKIVKTLVQEPMQSYALNTSLTASTGIKQPRLMDDWKYLLEAKLDGDVLVRALESYESFKTALVRCEIENCHRQPPPDFPFNNFNPSLLEPSVSK